MSRSSESLSRGAVADQPSHDSDGWRASWGTARARAPMWDPPVVATTVVVPHPDDEVLMFGGLIQMQRRRGVDVYVIAVTDGEAAYPDVDADRLGAIRHGEHERALAALGVDLGAVHRLGLPDGAVADRYGAIVDAIVDVDTPLVVAPWVHDHHCDHEASGRAARVAGARTGAATYFGLFWSWTQTDPVMLARQRLIRLPLTPDLLAGRHTAIAEHRSQVTDDIAPAMLIAGALFPLDWADEYYITDAEPS